MPENPDPRFGHDTLKFRAVFVRQGASNPTSSAEIADTLGHDVAKIPAVIVQPGGPRPGYPYEHLGNAEFRPSENEATRRTYTVSQGATRSSDDTADDDKVPVPTLPRTRYRFGALAGGATGSNPPLLARSKRDPLQTPIGILRYVANLGRTKPAHRAGSASRAGDGRKAAPPGDAVPPRAGGEED